jgi:hypothetical protein
MWTHFVTAYLILLQSRSLTKPLEEDAAEELQKFAKAVEKVVPPPSSRLCFVVLKFFFSFFLFFFFFEAAPNHCLHHLATSGSI